VANAAVENLNLHILRFRRAALTTRPSSEDET